MKTVRAILIDPHSKTITERFIEPKLQSFYQTLDCTTIEGVYPKVLGESAHFIYCDEEGLFKKERHYFHVIGYHSALTGKAIILKSKEDEEVSCTLSVPEVWQMITFLDDKL